VGHLEVRSTSTAHHVDITAMSWTTSGHLQSDMFTNHYFGGYYTW